jgi:hypothetical protein
MKYKLYLLFLPFLHFHFNLLPLILLSKSILIIIIVNQQLLLLFQLFLLLFLEYLFLQLLNLLFCLNHRRKSITAILNWKYYCTILLYLLSIRIVKLTVLFFLLLSHETLFWNILSKLILFIIIIIIL